MSSVELRTPTLDDVAELVRLGAELEERVGAGGMSEAQVRQWLTSTRLPADENHRIAIVEGHVAGWVGCWYPEEGSDRIFFNAGADPSATDVLELLVEWGEGRARRFANGRRVRVHAGAPERNPALAEILRRHGFELVRHFFRMELDLTDELPQPVWPEGIAVRRFRPGEERAVWQADSEAFEDHWDSFVVPFEEWKEYFFGSSEFDPTLWFIAEAGDEIAGIALCWNERRPSTGHVNAVGVRRPWRRRGIATALLLHSFHEFRRRGRTRVDLNVDADSLTGAVALYERVGMRVVHRDDTYRKEIA